MQINPVAPPPAAVVQMPPQQAARVSPSQVSAAVLQRANGDGDGRTGAAALNDGDAAAHAAAQQVRSAPRSIDVRA
jgi:hypothetical protein